MRDILISSTVCVLCLLLALVSQLVAPSTVNAAAAANTSAATASVVNRSAPVTAAARSSFELDPDDPNPTLFAMAPDTNQADASALGGPLDAPDTQITASGLKITELKVGEGAEAASGQTVQVHYRGTLENGKQFDASYDRGQPISFGLSQVIPGWTEGMQLIGEGGAVILVIPSDLGYGDRGSPPTIPGGATLVFYVETLGVQD